jgi:peptide/nickel transport system substrate-binding protein
MAPAATPPVVPLAATTPVPAGISLPLEPALPVRRKGPARLPAALLIGLAVLVVAAGVLGSLSLLAHFGVLGAHSAPHTLQVARGGTWSVWGATGSLIPNSGADPEMMDALYLPLFSGDAQSVIHAAAATEVPTIGNGGVSADATTWTFHLRPGLVWSDGQPYDARDVDFTWRLWKSTQFGASTTLGLNLISSAVVSADHLSITFHLSRPFAPFLADLWVDGVQAPLPAHHFSSMAPAQILKSSENLNPKVTSGPFMMAQSVPEDHFTLVRNPRYYLAREGLPYLDKLVFTALNHFPLNELQAGSLDTTGVLLDVPNFQVVQHLKDYTLIYPPTQNGFEALYFNFHNTLLASHPEVRQAMAMAVDQQTLIAQALHGLGTELCTDHPSAYHPGYELAPPCPVFGLAAANQVLDDAGWVKGKDGVRTKGGQRLEFEYSTQVTARDERAAVQAIIQRDFGQIGIKLDIQNYSNDAFFGSLLPRGKASPPTGALAGRYDIAEFETGWSYDPDDSYLLSCNQFPPQRYNINFYCNPALDKLYAQEQATADPGVRQQIFEQIHRIYLAQFPFIVLYGPTVYAVVRKGTHNYLPGPFTDSYNIAQWWCDHAKC